MSCSEQLATAPFGWHPWLSLGTIACGGLIAVDSASFSSQQQFLICCLENFCWHGTLQIGHSYRLQRKLRCAGPVFTKLAGSRDSQCLTMCGRLTQIHWPVVEPQQAGELDPSIQETWQALEECVDEVSDPPY